MSDPAELLELKLDSIIQGEATAKGIHFFLQVGARYDARGITTLQISGSGWVFLSFRRDEEIDTYSYQLKDHHLLGFYSKLMQHPFWRAKLQRRKRNKKIDEANVHLRLSDQNKGICNVQQFWTTDIPTSKHLVEIFDYFTKLIYLLSEHEIKLDISSTPLPTAVKKKR